MSGADTSSNLLLDLLHCVFEQLERADDTRALNACSRTCRLWFPIARRYLFTQLPISAIPNRRQSLPWIEWHGFWRPACVDLSLVTRLEINNDRNRSDNPLTLSRLIPILQALPILNTLQISGGSIRGFCPTPIPTLYLPMLKTLGLICLTAGEQTQDVLDVIHSFRTVRSLEIMEDEVDLLTIDPSGTLYPPVWEQFRLPVGFAPSSLSIYRLQKFNMPYLDLFTRLGAVTSLRDILLVWWDLDNIIEDTSLFLSKATSLETLTFDCNMNWDFDPIASPPFNDILESSALVQRTLTPALSPLRSLHTFSFTPINAPPHSVEWILGFAMLKALPSHLANFELHLHERSMHLDLMLLRDCLGRLHGLRTVKAFFDEAEMESPPTIMAVEGFSARFHEVLRDIALRGVTLDVLWEFRP